MATGGRRLSESRCPHCGALVSENADWCTQCFQSLRKEPELPQVASPQPKPQPVTTETLVGGRKEPEDGGAEGPKKAPFWACPVCHNDYDLDTALCPVCVTPFGQLFEESDDHPRIAPEKAGMYGLLPGYGHLKCGRGGEAIARMFFALGVLAITAMFAFSAEAGVVSTVLAGMFACLLLFSVGESSLDARKLAAGERELITGRQLLWIFIGAFGLAVLLVVFLSIGQTPNVSGG